MNKEPHSSTSISQKTTVTLFYLYLVADHSTNSSSVWKHYTLKLYWYASRNKKRQILPSEELNRPFKTMCIVFLGFCSISCQAPFTKICSFILRRQPNQARFAEKNQGAKIKDQMIAKTALHKTDIFGPAQLQQFKQKMHPDCESNISEHKDKRFILSLTTGRFCFHTQGWAPS